MAGLYLLMYIERVPNDSTSFVTAVSKPAITDAMSITVMTPIITPVTVRKERSLLARNVPRASHRFSIMSLRKSFITKSPRVRPQADRAGQLSRPGRFPTPHLRPPIHRLHQQLRPGKDTSEGKFG